MSPENRSTKPLASVSMDLDNRWSYLKTHGDAGWETFPSYLDIFIPYILDLLDRQKLKITFFIVGQDAVIDKNKEFLKLIPERGHEVGNHSFHHEPWFHTHPRDYMKEEIIRADEQILEVTGNKPIGFRGPGWSWNANLVEILSEIHYVYDSSTFPTYIGPLARAYYLRNTFLSKKEKEQRKELFGCFKDGRRSLKPYFWKTASGSRLLELPVTTIPIFKIPFHLSYLLYISRISPLLLSFYMKCALALCRITVTEPSFLLHPLDFLDSDHVPELAFFPGMDVSRYQKLEIFKKVMKTLSRYFTPVTMDFHARSIIREGKMRKFALIC